MTIGLGGTTVFTNIIIGVDDLHGPRGVGATARLARALAPKAQVLLAIVVPAAEDSESGLRTAFKKAAHDQAIAILERARDQIAMPDAQLSVAYASSVAKGLKALAAQEGADLLIIGAAHHGSVGRTLLGDVAHGVLSGAPCPVVVAPHEQPRGEPSAARIGVAFDWSPEAAHALDLAVDVAKQLGSRLEVIEAQDVGVIPAVWGFQIADYLDGLLAPEQERLDELVRGLGVTAHGEVIQGAAHEILADASNRLDLVICGSRGWGPAGRLAFGSIAERLMHHARCAVLVVPRGAERAIHADPVTARAGTEATAQQAEIYAGSPSTVPTHGTRG